MLVAARFTRIVSRHAVRDPAMAGAAAARGIALVAVPDAPERSARLRAVVAAHAAAAAAAGAVGAGEAAGADPCGGAVARDGALAAGVPESGTIEQTA